MGGRVLDAGVERPRRAAIGDPEAEAIRADLRTLAVNPATRALRIKALKGKLKGFHRLRRGKWRAIFKYVKVDRIIFVIEVNDRKDSY